MEEEGGGGGEEEEKGEERAFGGFDYIAGTQMPLVFIPTFLEPWYQR
jgi:hypothetical protein